MKEKEEQEIKTKENKKNPIKFSLTELIIMLLMTTIIVGLASGVIVYKNFKSIKKVENNFNSTNYISEFEDVYNNILNNYVENVDEKELVNAAIDGMYNYLGDPHTSYLDEDLSDDLTDRLNGYKGIGVEISKIEEGILVVNVFKDGPASLAGLERGDVIVRINGKDVSKSTAAEAQSLIKNSKNDKVEVSFLRGGITKTIEINLKNVNVPTIESNNFNGIGYIKITSFSNKTSEQFEKALKKLEDEGIKSLLIDVRNNGGGYLNAASEIAELFIEKGKTIYGLETKNGTKYYSDQTKESRNYKVSILMNSASASASEILISALKESYGATLLGTKSYGKGTVQETEELSSGGMVKYTTAYWLTPEGNKINGLGISPDIEITGNYIDGMSYEEDTILQTALNTVK